MSNRQVHFGMENPLERFIDFSLDNVSFDCNNLPAVSARKICLSSYEAIYVIPPTVKKTSIGNLVFSKSQFSL